MRIALSGLISVACLGATHADGAVLDEPMKAIAANDCRRLGAWVNDREAGSRTARDYMAGLMYEEGFCVERSLDRAASLYRTAEAAPDVGAASEIGLRYATGDVLPQSYVKAGPWLLHADSIISNAQDKTRPIVPLNLPVRDGPMPAGEQWIRYLLSVHYVATQIIRRERGRLQTINDADVTVTLCPGGEPFQIEASGKAKAVTGALSGSVSRTKAETDVTDAYRKAGQLLPRVSSAGIAANDESLCVQRKIGYRIR